MYVRSIDAEIVEDIIEAANELDSSTVEIEKSQSDIAEEDKLTKFLEKMCCNRQALSHSIFEGGAIRTQG